MDSDLKLDPHHIRGASGVWWYELPNGIEIHVENTAINPRTAQAVVRIGWGKISKALGRGNAKKKKKR